MRPCEERTDQDTHTQCIPTATHGVRAGPEKETGLGESGQGWWVFHLGWNDESIQFSSVWFTSKAAQM